MPRTYIGIDPGLHGAVGCIHSTDISIKSLVFNTPLKKVGDKHDYDIPEMCNILKTQGWNPANTTVVIENVFSRPMQGVSSVFSFGRGKGLWEGICYALGFKVVMVAPATWKKTYDLIQHHPRSKDNKPKTEKEKKEIAKQKRLLKAHSKVLSREKARLYFPELAGEFDKVNSDGRAEALLLASYGRSLDAQQQ